nr:MAG TPA: hypothetical protein [Bacteriophage sp.]
MDILLLEQELILENGELLILLKMLNGHIIVFLFINIK